MQLDSCPAYTNPNPKHTVRAPEKEAAIQAGTFLFTRPYTCTGSGNGKARYFKPAKLRTCDTTPSGPRRTWSLSISRVERVESTAPWRLVSRARDLRRFPKAKRRLSRTQGVLHEGGPRHSQSGNNNIFMLLLFHHYFLLMRCRRGIRRLLITVVR
jgi:hypothetical protein